MAGRQWKKKYIFIPAILIILTSSILIVCSTTSCFASGEHDNLFSINFVNEKDGWACGYWGTIIHTTDGGKNWVQQKANVDTVLASVFFIDPEYGWIVGSDGTIIHTADGGKSWTSQKSPEKIFLTSVRFVNREKGWAAGENMTILHTADGGKTWSVQFKGEDLIFKAISFSDENNGWVVGEYGYIYHTTDGGKKWVKQAGSFGFSSETGLIEGGTYLFGLAVIDANNAWAVGIDGYVITTSDGGKTWRQINTGAPKVHLFGVAADKTGNIVITGKGLVMASDDNGKTWRTQKLSPPATYGWIYAVTPVGGRTFAACGWGGNVYMQNKADGVWNGINYQLNNMKGVQR